MHMLMAASYSNIIVSVWIPFASEIEMYNNSQEWNQLDETFKSSPTISVY